MSNEQMKFTLDFLAKTTGLKDAAKFAQKLGDQLEDTEDAAKLLARAMDMAAEDMEADIRETTAIAEKLGNALGPELRAKIGQSGLDQMAADFRQAGLSAQQVDANIDELTAGVKRLDAAADKATDQMKQMGKDQSNSVRANYLGNAASEVAQIGGVVGSANVAVGQFVEYTADGNMNLKKMAAMAGPLIGVAVAMQLVADQQKRVAEAKAWRKENVDAFVKSIRAGEDAAEALADRLEEAGKIDLKIGGVLDEVLGGDLVDNLANAGLTIEQFTKAATGGPQALEDLGAALDAAGVSAEDASRIMFGAQTYQDQYNQSVKTAAELSKVFGEELDRTGKLASDALDSLKKFKESVGSIGDEARDAAGEIRGIGEELDELDNSDAVLDLEDQFADLQTAAEEAWIATATGAEDAEEKQRNYKRAVNDTKREVIDYATEMGNIPDEVVTKVLADIDEGTITSAEHALSVLSRARYSTLYVTAKTTGLSSDVAKGRASGGPYNKGDLVMTGERGPELEYKGSAGHVFSNEDTKRILGGAGGNTYNITVNAPSVDANQVVKIIKEHMRRNGGSL